LGILGFPYIELPEKNPCAVAAPITKMIAALYQNVPRREIVVYTMTGLLPPKPPQTGLK